MHLNKKVNKNNTQKTKQKKNMKPTIVIYGSSTGACQAIAETIASKLNTQAVDVAKLDADTLAKYDNLILGTSTW